MDENDIAARLAIGALRLYQNLHSGLGLMELRFDGEARGIEAAGPEVTGDRQNMVVRYDWAEGAQSSV